MAMGKDIAGKAVVADLAKMPHVLVAGTTGSGKSVAINAMILSLLYKATPQQVRLLLVDPKMLELSVYEGIPHLLCPVVTDMRQAASGLNWCVQEMDRRYKLMSALGVRNIAGYNQKVREAIKAEKPLTNPFTITPDSPEPLEELPLIVVFIDELADLMMVVGKKIEELIARLAQKARASGIHLVLATQRPSVDVITGLIKANVPTRMALQVASQIDSRTILDGSGAETLLGAGDMLYLSSDMQKPVRIQTAFISENEVRKVVSYIKSHNVGDLSSIDFGGNGAGAEPNDVIGLINSGFDDDDIDDDLYADARATVETAGRASTSYLQRKLKIGYSRAARLMDILEERGIIGGADGSKPREILTTASDGRRRDSVEPNTNDDAQDIADA